MANESLVASNTYSADVVIAGAGLAGIVAAYELLDQGKRVLLIDKDKEANFGGLAKESFGGVHVIGTPLQRRLGIHDTPDLGYRDWEAYAEFGDGDVWPRKWARLYCDSSFELIYRFLHDKGVRFLPIVNWVERGVHRTGNSVPRWHIAWGTGFEIIRCVVNALERHPKRAQLTVLFDHEVNKLEINGSDGNARIVGVNGRSMRDGSGFVARGEHVVIASGGICGGDLSKMREHWFKDWGAPPKIVLNGAHIYADGMLHDQVKDAGGNLTHLDKHWHYAAGIHHPAKRKPLDGLSLVPPRSALWMDAHGRRIGPVPLVGYTDTRFFVDNIVRRPGGYSWQVLNWKIAIKELAVSGSDYMTAFRNKRRLQVAKELLFGNKALIERLIRECPEDIVVGNTLPELVAKMNERSLDGYAIDGAGMEEDIRSYDAQIDRGEAYFNDDQLRRIMNFRTYRGDRLRLCKYQKIVDGKALPLIAIREFILSRKSLGGIQTDLQCRVLRPDGTTIAGLYAVGEAAGFGGGGIHGLGALEGAFLGSCVLTGRIVGKAIANS